MPLPLPLALVIMARKRIPFPARRSWILDSGFWFLAGAPQ